MAHRTRRILIAIGNPLRRDDGAAQRVLELLPASARWETRACQQLTPELAAEIALYRMAVFLDADATAERLRWESLPSHLHSSTSAQAALSHTCRAGEIVALAAALFGFSGTALLCRLPARDFSCGEGLSPIAEGAAIECAQRLQFGLPHELHLAGEEEAGDEQASDLRHESDAPLLLRDLR